MANNRKPIRLIGAAIGSGAQDPRTEYAAEVLQEGGLTDRLAKTGMQAEWKIIVYPHYGRDKSEPFPLVADFNARLMRTVADTLAKEQFPLVIGGDHSCAIGTWSGVRKHMKHQGTMGLIWIDAHMDAHTPDTTPSGALHGMPLAALLGYGEDALVSLDGAHPKVLPQHVCLIGVRSFEVGESDLLTKLGVRIIYMEEVRRIGFAAALREAINIAELGTDGFGVTFDLDAIDPSEAPGVGSPAPGGVGAQDAISALEMLHDNPHLLAFEITEYSPFIDQQERTAKIVEGLIMSVAQGASQARKLRA